MYRILIADDEYWTREKIRNMIEWEQYGLEFLEPAEDGEDALQRMEDGHPDIVITDINMPFVNGIELVKAIREKYPQVIVIVLSGYDDFDYVRSTLVAGAVDYLLKPATEADLVNVLSRALETLAKRKAETEQESKKRDQLLRASSLLQDREFSAMIEAEEPIQTPDISINLNMDSAGYRLVLIKIHNLAPASSQFGHDMSLLSYNLKKEIRVMVECKNFIVFNYIYKANEFIFLSELEYTKLRELLKNLLVKFESITHSPITIAVSQMAYSLSSIRDSYLQTMSLLMQRPFCRNSVIVTEKKKEENSAKETAQGRIGGAEEKSLKILIEAGNKSKIRSVILDEIGLKNAGTEGWSYLKVRKVLKRIVAILTTDCTTTENALQLAELDSLSDLMNKTLELLDLDAVFQILEQMIDLCIDAHRVEISETISGTVVQVAQYIQENYHETFSLSQLAKRFLVESSYLSKAFRQQMGENLMVYIARQKIEKAKEYIQQGNITLTEISFLVGYDDYNYFSRVFKKMTGISPREYKASMGEIK